MTERKRVPAELVLNGLTADHRCLIAQACLDESKYSPASYAVELEETDDGTPRRIEALHVAQFGRFGNLLVQIGHALDVAKFLGVDTIYYDVAVQAPGVFEADRIVEVDGIRMIATSHAMPTIEKTLTGTFWSLHLLFSADVAPLCKRDVVLSQELYPLLSENVRRNLFSLRNDDVVAHFRGGDVFRHDFNLDYVQPPFGFYRKALTEALKRGGTVHIVCEDRLNPAVDATVSWLGHVGHAFEVHSGELRDDLKVMLAAHHIVASYGTFVSAIMKISPNIRSVYVFDNRWVTQDQRRFRSDVHLMEYEDAQGGYTKHGEWRASPEQIALIVDYDIDSIVEIDRTS